MSRVSRCACGKVRSSVPATAPTIAAPKKSRRCSAYHHTLLDLRAQFVETVVRPFAQDYLRGRTPNPCVACNRDFKLGTLLKWAKEQGVDYVATGHYARVVRDVAADAYRYSAARIPARISLIFSSRSVTPTGAHAVSARCDAKERRARNRRGGWACRSPIVRKARISASAIIRPWWNPTRVRTSLVAVMW